MTKHARSLEQIVDDQVREWQLRNRTDRKARERPVVAVSRLPGSGGRMLAERLAAKLGFDFFDKEIVHRVAESAHLSDAVAASLDERVRSELEHWMLMLERERYLWPYEYLQHLAKVVGTIGQHGGAVLVGRGASFLLPRERCVRVLVVAPLKARVARVCEAQKVSADEAERRILRTEADRQAFIRRFFRAEMCDPLNYDLVLNTEAISLEVGVELIRMAVAAKTPP